MASLYAQADVVAFITIQAGDAEHYHAAIYNAQVSKGHKGVNAGRQIYFGAFISYAIGDEYLVFLKNTDPKLFNRGDKMLRQIVFLLIMSPSLPQSVAVTSDELPSPYNDADAYNVYWAILPSEWPLRVANARTLVIRNATKGFEMCLVPEKESEEILGPVIFDYAKMNEKTWLLQQKFSPELPYKLITSDGLESTFEQGGWEGFYRQHPDSGGWIELSVVGFNTDKTVAVVYMGHHCGLLCGGGGFHVLRKKDGKWTSLEWRGTSCAWAS